MEIIIEKYMDYNGNGIDVDNKKNAHLAKMDKAVVL